MLAVARALMIDPELILMDEPSEGLAPIMVQHLEDIVADLKKDGLSILLVEQNLYTALAVADRVYILETGKVVHEATSSEIARDPQFARQIPRRQLKEPSMLPTERLAYSPITKRKPLALPNGARMVVWTITNVEEWDATQPMPRTVLSPPAGGSPIPDIPNWCWHEYGNRVGFWRLLKVYDEFEIPGVMNINGIALAAYPDIVEGRGRAQMGVRRPRLHPAQHAEGRQTSARTSATPREAIEKATGKRPRGWLGPGLTETWETPDILDEEGYEYVADWVLDDQPVWLKTRGKPIVSVPYTQECNDVAMMLIQHHKASEFYERAIDQFEQIYADAEGSARVMAISVHPYIMGAPHRTKYFRRIFETIRKKHDVLFWNGEQISTGISRPGRRRRRLPSGSRL